MTALFHTPEVPAPAPAPSVPKGPTEEEKKAALEKERALARRAKGRRSTLLTGGIGLTSEANVQRKTLLGQ